MTDVVEFLRARLDEDEAAAKNQTCINCGRPLAPVGNALGTTGYTHHGEWQGQRCPGRLTGAEPVQNPARVLREVEAKRLIIDWVDETYGPDYLLYAIALPYADHEDFKDEWRP